MDEIDVENNTEIYNNLCKIYGKEDIGRIIDISKINSNSADMHDLAARLFGRKGLYVLERLSLMSTL